LPFDPYTTEALAAALDSAVADVRTIVLSPQTDPLPPLGPVRAESARVAQLVLERGLDLVILTRGRFSRRLIQLLAAYPQQVRVGVGLFSLSKPLVRELEPLAASPYGRIRDIRRLAEAGIPVEVRLEPLIPGLTDTRANLVPLFRKLSEVGATRVVAHYLFLNPKVQAGLTEAFAGLRCKQTPAEMFADGPKATVGTIGLVRNLPREVRREGLARVMSWGAEFGLEVTTGAAQNPDLPRNPTPAAQTGSSLRRRSPTVISGYPTPPPSAPTAAAIS